MTSTTEPKETATKTAKMSRESTRWDQAEKGFLTDAERIAKNMDVEGKGYLSREQAVALGAQFQSLKDDYKQIKNQLYGLAILCVLLFIGTVAGTVMAVKNSKDTIVDMKTGVMKVNDGAGGVDIVTVKAQGTTFKTVASIEVEEDIFDSETNETSTGTYTSYCVSAEDVASMWVANEQGSDARLVMLKDVNDDGIINEDDDDDTEISRIQPVTIGPASWKKDRIVMGSMIFTANEECGNAVRRKRRMLLQENNNDIEQNENKKDDMPSFDPILIHRALKQRVDILTGRHLWGCDDNFPSPGLECGSALNETYYASPIDSNYDNHQVNYNPYCLDNYGNQNPNGNGSYRLSETERMKCHMASQDGSYRLSETESMKCTMGNFWYDSSQQYSNCCI